MIGAHDDVTRMHALSRTAGSRQCWILAALIAFSWSHPSVAGNELLGIHQAWTAQTYIEDGAKVCMTWSQPEKAEGNYTTRGEIYVFVTHRPKSKRRDEIRFEAGYPFEPAADVKVTIDKEQFSLASDASTAWVDDSKSERRLIHAMRAGLTMVVEGTSSRGTKTRDTYSLSGFSAAHAAIDGACGS